jgi:uncharacterized membrane protein (DUF485 family)
MITARGVNTRLVLYVAAAMLTQFIGDAESLRAADVVGVAIFAAKVLLAGVIVWRAFIDQSKGDYEKASEVDLRAAADAAAGDGR